MTDAAAPAAQAETSTNPIAAPAAQAGAATPSAASGDGAPSTMTPLDDGVPVTGTANIMADPAKPASGGLELPDELKNDPALSKFADKTPADLAKAYVELQKTMGNRPTIPGADATDEQKAAFDKAYRETMVPKTPQDYGLTKPENLPPELDQYFNEDKLNEFADFAHEQGLTTKQVQALRDWDAERASVGIGNSAEKLKEMETAFMGKFEKVHGADANKVLDSAADLLMKHSQTAEERTLLQSMPEGARMAMANMLHNIAKTYIGEDRLPGSQGGAGGASLAELQQQLKSVIASNAYRNEFDSGHSAAKAHSQEIAKNISLLQQQGAK